MSKNSKSFIYAALITSTLISSTCALAESYSSKNSPQHAAGISLGSLGIGVNFSQKTNWSLASNDQVQWYIEASTINAENEDGADIGGIDYNDGDLSMASIQTGLNWYPYVSGWADEVFFAAGLMYSNVDMSGKADTDKSFHVGDQLINPGDITSLDLEIEESQVLPYVSVGWGNKLMGKPGFDFRTELGFAIPTQNVDVKLTAVDSNNILTDANLAKEKDEIEDDLNNLRGFITATVTYQF